MAIVRVISAVISAISVIGPPVAIAVGAGCPKRQYAKGGAGNRGARVPAIVPVASPAIVPVVPPAIVPVVPMVIVPIPVMMIIVPVMVVSCLLDLRWRRDDT